MTSTIPPIIITTDDAIEAMRVDPSGNVGIGTATPGQTLTVHGDLSVYVPSSGSPISAFALDVESFQTINNAIASYFLQVRDIDAAPPGGLVHFCIRGDGNVGIGTPSPQKPLDVAAGGGIQISQSDDASSNNELYFQDNGQIRSLDDNHRIIFDRANNILELREFGDVVFSSGATSGTRTQTVTFTSNGNVGIGTTGPNNQLVVAAQASFGGNTGNTGTEPIEVQGPGAGVSFYDRTGGSTGRWVIYSDRTGGAGTEALRFWSANDKVTITQGGDISAGGTISGVVTSPGAYGVYGRSTQLSASGTGVRGESTSGVGVAGWSQDGVAIVGHNSHGPAAYICTQGFAGIFQGNVNISGNLSVGGQKGFVQEHPTDPTKQIVYVSLEGGEAGTYTRGTWKLENGKALIELPEHFGLVTSEDDLTIQLTPRGEWLQLYVVRLTTRQVVVQEAQGKSGQFDYLIQGVRKGYEHHEVIQQKKEP
jgi:hypothetical protein